MTVGMIVRCDQGGLGNQTYALWRHLRPDVTLLLDLPAHKGRGRGEPSKYQSDFTTLWTWKDDVIPRQMLRDLSRAVDTLLTVETFYSGSGQRVLELADTHTMLVANTELYTGLPATQVVVPTPWELKRMPTTVKVVPHPTENPPEKVFRRRHVCQTFLHVAAPAMLDRNGTNTVMKALKNVDEECQLIVHAPFMSPPWEDGNSVAATSTMYGKVHVRWDPRPKKDYWDVYDVEADVLLLPRRYGGLCLPMQEAASCAMPAVMSDLPPQEWWPCWRAPARVTSSSSMRGGTFDVHDVNPVHLASLMTDLVRGELDVELMSNTAWEWSRTLSWETLGGAWRDLVRVPA